MKTIEDLKNEKDKMSIFLNYENLLQYVRTIGELVEAIISCLDDKQKFEIMSQNYFKKLQQSLKTKIVKSIEDDKIKSQIIHDTSLLGEIFNDFNFVQFLLSVGEEDKIYVLNSPEILEKFNITKYNLREILKGVSSQNKIRLLEDKERIKQAGFTGVEIAGLIIDIEDDEIKSKLSDEYKLDEFSKSQVIKSFNDENKERIILEDKYGFNNRTVLEMLSLLEVENAVKFINNHQDFLQEKNIKPYQFIKNMSTESQLKIIEQIAEMQISEGEKRRIFATLKTETKDEIEVSKIDEKYRQLLGLQLSEDMESYGRIVVDIDSDLSQYQDLDEILSINILEMIKSDEKRQKLIKLCEICPNIKMRDKLTITLNGSTGQEFIQGEEWISSVLDGIQEQWTDVQKLAYIDTAIGKKMSYTPEFGTEAENLEGSRALWKIISSGYGVCNGIAQIEQYLLSRVGIESDRVDSKTHTFVKVKNIAIPTENGIMRGDTLVDPTWNLTASRYGCLPHHFCKSYDELRKVDIDENGKDHECHKIEELEQTATINMDIESLRQVYQSIGIADKDGNFPIKNLIEQTEKIDETSNDMQTKINMKFELLKKWCPEFATCQNSTISVLKSILLENNENFEFKRCIVSRVYDRTDAKKQAVLYVYMETEEGKQFFYADKEKGEFITLSQEEFETKFECYETDRQKITGNKRPWETIEELVEKKENSSGQVSMEEGR